MGQSTQVTKMPKSPRFLPDRSIGHRFFIFDFSLPPNSRLESIAMGNKGELISRLQRRIDEIHAAGNEIEEPFDTTEEKNERLFEISLYCYPPYSTLVIISILKHLISEWNTLDELDRDHFLCSLPAVLDYEDKSKEPYYDELSHDLTRTVLSCHVSDRVITADAFRWIYSNLTSDDSSHAQFERMAKYWSEYETT